MDAQILGLGLTLGTVIVGVTLYAAKARGTAESALHKARNVETAHVAYVAHADAVFARKETITAELDSIKASLKRIEAHQEMMATRIMNGGAGA